MSDYYWWQQRYDDAVYAAQSCEHAETERVDVSTWWDAPPLWVNVCAACGERV